MKVYKYSYYIISYLEICEWACEPYAYFQSQKAIVCVIKVVWVYMILNTEKTGLKRKKMITVSAKWFSITAFLRTIITVITSQ